MNHISLFTGIGGIDLAAEAAGFETIAFCECNPYAQKVLRKHWPDVPIIEDVKDVTRERIEGIMADTECKLRTSKNETNKTTKTSHPITLLTGGVPCQPASVAGKRRGTEDDRWLWPEALRILSEIRPTWAVFENPTGILTLEDGVVFNNLLSQMEAEGYEVQPIIIPACAVNAPHRRDRCFIVAHTTDSGIERMCQREKSAVEDVSDTVGQYDDRGRHEPSNVFREQSRQAEISGRWHWKSEPNVGRVANGVSSRVDRLRCLGNAVVPAQVYPILKAIADAELANSLASGPGE